MSVIFGLRTTSSATVCVATGAPHWRTHSSHKCALFDYLVRASKKGVWNLKAKRLGRLEIDHKLEFRRLYDGQRLGLLAFQNSPDIDARLMIHLECVRPVAHKAATVDRFTSPVHRRKRVTRCKLDDMFGPR